MHTRMYCYNWARRVVIHKNYNHETKSTIHIVHTRLSLYAHSHTSHSSHVYMEAIYTCSFRLASAS